METTKQPQRILSEFAPHSYEEWKQAAIELLKGRPFEKTLITPTYEGFALEPLYVREGMAGIAHLSSMPGLGNRVRGSSVEGYLRNGWKISQELSAPTPAELNGLILEGLDGGQNEISLWLDGPTRGGVESDVASEAAVGFCGLSLQGLKDLEVALRGVHPEMVSLYILGGAVAPEVYAAVLAWAAEKGVDLAQLSGCIGYDPLGWLLETGELAGGMDRALDRMEVMLRDAIGAAHRLQVVEVRGHGCNNAGSSSCQELAYVLAAGYFYLKSMVERGLDAASVAARMRLSVSIGSNYFIEIAKLRALRLLWSRLLEAFGVEECGRSVHVHARTGLFNKTVFDPYVNMLRTTAEAFAAVVGGCDSLHVGPFDEIIRESDAFSRRIARNTHWILAEECGLNEVLDPAGGSWAVETLTDKMAAKAWELMQATERAGGVVSTVASGQLQSEVAAVRAQRLANIQQRRDIIVGTNAYPNANEQLLTGGRVDYAAARAGRLAQLRQLRAERDGAAVTAALAAVRAGGGIAAMVVALKAGATVAEVYAAAPAGGAALTAEPLRLRRAAEEYEQLRLAAAGMAASGQPARILQLNMGPSRRYRARADWTSAFFQVGGFEVLNDQDFADADAALAAIANSGAPVAVITSDDETYAATVVELAGRIKAAHPQVKLIVAGAPGEAEAAWRAAGVDDFVHIRVNNYRFNRSLLEAMGASI